MDFWQFLNPIVVQLQAFQQSEYHILIVPVAIIAVALLLRLLWGVVFFLISPFGDKHPLLVGLVTAPTVLLLGLLVYNPALVGHYLPDWQSSLGQILVAATGFFLLLALWKLVRSVFVAGFWASVCLVLVGAVFFDRMPQEWLQPGVAAEITSHGLAQVDSFLKPSSAEGKDLDAQLQLSLMRYLAVTPHNPEG